MSRTLLNERLSNLRQDQKEPRKHTKAAPGGTRHWLGESNHCILGRCYQSKAKIANLFLKMGWNKLKKWPLEVEHLLQSWKKSPDSSALTAKSSRTPPRCISFAKMNLVRLLCLSWTNLDSRWCRGRYSWHRWLLSEEDMCRSCCWNLSCTTRRWARVWGWSWWPLSFEGNMGQDVQKRDVAQ